jgi:thiol-disulfide isomerase/thioredoxin
MRYRMQAVRTAGGRPVALLAALALAVLLLPAGAAAQDVGLEIGAVPDAVQVEDLDGNAVSLGDYIGRKPLIVQFWATWCPLCSALEPRLRAARSQYGDRLEIVFVAVGVNQTPRTIRRHQETHRLPGVMVFDGRGRAARAFRAPTTSYVVALDARGRVVYTGVGADQDIAAAAAKAVGR